jgi:hypothetical protein
LQKILGIEDDIAKLESNEGKKKKWKTRSKKERDADYDNEDEEKEYLSRFDDDEYDIND